MLLLEINQWELKKFLRFILMTQVLILGLTVLDVLGFHITILRELFGFLYLIFIPGLLLLRIIDLKEINILETLLYSVGLSLSFLMFLGLIINEVFKNYQPLSLKFLLPTLTILVLGLSLICYIKEKDNKPVEKSITDISVNIEFLKNPIILLFILLPFMSILGTSLMNFYNQNILSLLMIILIIAITIYLSLKRTFPTYIYYMAIFSISISLLYNTTLISNYIWGWDIQFEYYLANIVLNSSFWNQTYPLGINGMLSVVILAPIFSKVLNLNMIWVFKIVYPTLFSLLPLGLFCIYKKQFDNKTAFLATFFFMAFVVFYVEMMQLARQQIAELFLVLLLLLMLNENINKLKRSILFVVFSFSLILSHYGISYLFMLVLIGVGALSVLIEKYKFKTNYFSNLRKNDGMKISITFLILFIVFGFAWYMFTSSASNFQSIIHIFDHIMSNITDLLSPASSQGYDLILTKSNSLLHSTAKYVQLIAQVFIALGVLLTVLTSKKTNINSTYLKFAIVAFFILILSIILPFFGSALNVTRIYHISLIFLAPFFLIGGKMIFEFINNFSKKIIHHKLIKNPFIILSLFLCLFFLFNVGFIYEITQDKPSSFSFNNNLDTPEFNQKDVSAANWILYNQYNKTVYADDGRYQLLSGLNIHFNNYNLPQSNSINLIYFGTYNTKNNKFSLLIREKTIPRKIYVPLATITANKSKLYDNGGSQIYY